VCQASEHFGRVLDVLGSWDDALDRVGFVLTSDQGQTALGGKDHVVDLAEVFDAFHQVSYQEGTEPSVTATWPSPATGGTLRFT
jgi:hypothetical protein